MNRNGDTSNDQMHIHLGLVFHNHQPVGQADHVFEEIYHKAYEPMIAALERHPTVEVGLHYTGSLLDWLVQHRPEFIQRVRALVQRGQVEILSGGYYEPILPSIPDDDKHGQIVRLTQAVRDIFGYDPTGMWLAERVWEPTLPTYLAGAGMRWTLVDDIHFKMVGLTDDDLVGYYMTENNGQMVGVFGTSKQLRYTIPWRPVRETLDYMRSQLAPVPGKVLVMGDDGEKFGAWPGTYELCWERGWVEEFFQMLEDNNRWLRCVKLGDYVHRFQAIGRIYLPTASYNEMMEWALPPQQSYEFSRLYHEMEEAGHPAVKYMRGGFWRNFLVKYPEVNTQHKKMLRVHDKIVEARRALAERGQQPQDDLGQLDLWHGQSNDTYWHGLFGGVYMTDVRVRVFAHLIRAQQSAERALYGSGDWLRYEITDFDCDSLHELLIEGSAINLYIDLDEGGSIFEWDLRPHNYNLASTVSRRPEGYHQVLREYEAQRRAREEVKEKKAARQTPAPDAAIGDQEEEALSPHEAVRVKEPGLDRYLNYDRYRRACMLEHFFGPGTTLDGFIRSDYNEEGDFVTGDYQAEVQEGGANTLHVLLERNGFITTPTERIPVRVSKRLTLRPGSTDFRVLYTIQNLSDTEVQTVFGSEWDINLLGGGHNPSAYYRVEGHELEDAALDSTGEVTDVREVAVGNTWLDIEMACRLSREATLWRFPLETISGSEAGFERVYQGSCVVLLWLLTLPPGQSVDLELEWVYRRPSASNA